MIKLCEGYYSGHLHITKPGIKIEPRDKMAYIMGSEGPVVTVDLGPGENFILN